MERSIISILIIIKRENACKAPTLCLTYIKGSMNIIKDDVDEVGEQKEERK